MNKCKPTFAPLCIVISQTESPWILLFIYFLKIFKVLFIYF